MANEVILPVRPGQGDAVIRTNGITKRFGEVDVVKGVTFDVPRARIFGFIGPSGSGKTTTIRMLTGYYAPTEGSLEVFGQPPTEFGQKMRARVGYMPQLFVLYPHLSVWENINFVASIYGMKIQRKEILYDVLDFVELSEHRKKLAREISGGMQRRLSLAATLVHEPDLIFLDEPTAGIDPVLRQKFWEGFREMRDNGRTLFVTTQYVSEAAYCDLVGVMNDGKLVAVDTPGGLRSRAFGGDLVDLRSPDRIEYEKEHQLRQLPYVYKVSRSGPTALRLVVDEASTAIKALLDWARNNHLEVETIEEYQPPFDDVFVELIRMEGRNER